MNSDPIIRVVAMDAGYEGSPAILENVNFEVGRGQVFGILGGSGCGKSTLLKHMIGLLPPLAGQAWIDGTDIVTAEGADLLATRRKFGVMYQSGALFGSMTLLENTRLPLEVWTDLPDDAVDLIARMKLELVGLESDQLEFHSRDEVDRIVGKVGPDFQRQARVFQQRH